MNRILLTLLGVMFLASCATPIPYYFNVETKNEVDNEVDMEGKEVAIFSVTDKEAQDSVFLNDIALGVAEKIEGDRGFGAESIPVYSVTNNDVDLSYYPSIYNVSKESGADLMIFISSLNFGKYIIEDMGSGKQNVKLGYNVKYDIYDKYSMTPIYKSNTEDELIWSIMSERKINNAEALTLVKKNIDKALYNAGESFAAEISTQWVPNERMLLSYSNDQWLKALDLATSFKWDEAVNIWLKFTDSEDFNKASAAAYNIALACDMMGDFDLADKWLDFAKSRHYFSEIDQLRNIVKQSRKRAAAAKK